MKVFNTLTRQKEGFVTIEPGKVRMYACGITVSSDARYTKVIIDTEQPVSYKFKYSASGISIDFKYTASVPKSLDNLTLNPNGLEGVSFTMV